MERILILSLPFERGLRFWLDGKPVPGTPSLFHLAERLAGRGVEVLWLMLDWTGPLPPGGCVLRKGSITVEIVPKPTERVARFLDDSERGLLHRLLKPYDFLFLRRATRVAAERFRPDAIYSVGVYSLLGTPLARRLGIPAITRMLGVFLGGYLDRWWKPPCTWNEITTLLVKPDLLIITNDGTRGDRVAARFGIPAEKLWFPVNGVDGTIVPLPGDRDRARAALGVTPNAPIVISVGRLVAWKRMDRVITAFKHAPANSQGMARLLMVGDGPERRFLEEHARTLGIAERVLFLGNVGRDDLRGYLAAADVAVFAYEHSNVGSALLEAMRAGKAILSIANGDTPRFVEHGVTGLLARPSAADVELGPLLSRLFADSALREQIGRAAADWAATSLQSWPQRMNRECEILEQLVYRARRVVSRAA
ncbi:MAG: glycosyltransferase family 4 protein [Planctomycetota bacterium]|nr:glycosyltransferase family 4 protein [Planctomycetota bacterium]